MQHWTGHVKIIKFSALRIKTKADAKTNIKINLVIKTEKILIN